MINAKVTQRKKKKKPEVIQIQFIQKKLDKKETFFFIQ